MGDPVVSCHFPEGPDEQVHRELEMNPGEAAATRTASTTRPWWQADRVAVLFLVVLAVAFWVIRRHGPGWAMEDPMMLQAPQRVLDGAAPGRDFDYFYGPLSLLIPAGVYQLISPSLVVARAVGAAYVTSIGLGLYLVGRRWSFAIGLAMGTIAVLIGALSYTALPIMGAIGALTVAVAFAVSDLSPRPRDWAVGLSCAVAVGLRPEFLLFSVVLLGALSLLRTVRVEAWIAWAVGHLPYVWLVAVAGLGTTWRNLVGDAAHIASERNLPWFDNLWDTGILVFIGAATALAAVILGVRRRTSRRGVALIGLGIIGLCLVPEYLQRADPVHVVYVTPVTLATLVPVAHELLGAGGVLRTRRGWRQAAAIGIAALVVLGLRPKFVTRATLRDVRTFAQGGLVYDVTNRGGTWYYRSAAEADAHARIVAAADRLAAPGANLFVGPAALDRPNYTDGSFYTLLPQYTQHTHFYDFHPRVAQVDGDRLAADVAAADLAILCDTGFDEANLSARPGSDAALKVIEERFEVVTEAGGCRLLENRQAPGGSDEEPS